MKKILSFVVLCFLFLSVSKVFAFEEVEIAPHFSETVESFHAPVEEENNIINNSWATNPANPASPIYIASHAHLNLDEKINPVSNGTDESYNENSAVVIVISLVLIALIFLVISVALF